MTFSQFKGWLKTSLIGNTVPSDDDTIKSFISECANYLLRQHFVLSHIEIDPKSFAPLYSLDEVYFVREFSAPLNDSSKIDFEDGALVGALLNMVASAMAVGGEAKEPFNRAANRARNAYEMSLNDPSLDTIAKLLAARGYAKPYSLTWAINKKYVWHEHFLKNLDRYLSDFAEYRGRNYERFINDFRRYQNGDSEVTGRADLQDLDRVMSERRGLANKLKAAKG